MFSLFLQLDLVGIGVGGKMCGCAFEGLYHVQEC